MAKTSFSDYKQEARNWITLAKTEYYPDYLDQAVNYYSPVLAEFRQHLTTSYDSSQLYRSIMASSNPWMRNQLCRVFRKYVSPGIPVELTKKKSRTEQTIQEFQGQFRKIAEAQAAFLKRPTPDEVLCALLWEYKSRGQTGYNLTEEMFEALRKQLPDMQIIGPERAGPDIQLCQIWPDFPNPNRPVDFVILEGSQARAIGLARYDGGRGGAQEDDRIGQYREVAQEVIQYCNARNLNSTKVIFINDGPGLLTGSMWDDYSNLDRIIMDRVRVATLRMIPERITQDWLRL